MAKRLNGVRAALWLSAVLVLASMTQAPRVQARPTPRMRSLSFPMVGVAGGQTARLNIVDISPPDPDQAPPDGDNNPPDGDVAPPDGDQAPPDPDRVCSVELSFLGADGGVITRRDGRQARLAVQLAGGHSAFLDLDAFDAIGPDNRPASETSTTPAVTETAQRAQIRAQVRASRACAVAIDEPNILPSLEIFDNATGRTSAFVQPGSTRFLKEVDPAPAH